VDKNLNFSSTKLYAWSDSAIVLIWLAKSSSRWTVYVVNRVGEIQSQLSSSQWRHGSTGDNPADMASRGLFPAELVDCKL